jgi:CxxH/CxxC protein (TIGR04129 family)
MPESSYRFACEEHMDVVIDGIVDDFAVAPTILPWPDQTVRAESPAVCHWCGKSADYVLTWTTESQTPSS